MVCFRTISFYIIDDIDDKVLCEISKFADDTKIASRVNTFNDIRSMQKTLDKFRVLYSVLVTNKWERCRYARSGIKKSN